MAKVVSNTLRIRNDGHAGSLSRFRKPLFVSKETLIQPNTKLMAWVIFLIFFIENGTLGLLPRQMYFLYRNVRVSDVLMYAVIIYSLFCIKEYLELFKSRSLFIVKLLFFYILVRFIASVFTYEVNLIEYFFRLKYLWASFMVFPFLLLMSRNGLMYLIKLFFPAAVVSNILFILTAITGTPFLPDVTIIKQTLPGGFEVYRVYGGTFYGDLFFLGFIYFWITKKFNFWQLFFVILFIIPHILAFGRGAWLQIVFTIALMLIWNSYITKSFRSFIKRTVTISFLAVSLIYSFTLFIPESDYYLEAINSRVTQGIEDVKYEEGTYGSRVENIKLLVDYWLSGNVLFGIGMHPLWVIKASTVEESYYAWGFADLRWPGVLTAYGLVGFLLALILQIYYLVISFKILKHSPRTDHLTFFVFMCFVTMIFDSFINYTYYLISVSVWILSFGLAFYVAAIVYKYESSSLQGTHKT